LQDGGAGVEGKVLRFDRTRILVVGLRAQRQQLTIFQSSILHFTPRHPPTPPLTTPPHPPLIPLSPPPLQSGATGLIPESTISPAPELLKYEDIKATPDASLLSQTVVLKLNGGLGTGMGLDKAKSLLKVKGNDTFLDLAAKQVLSMRENYGNVKFMLMNSFSTSDDTMSFLKDKYPSLVDDVEMLQNKVPKLDRETFLPATCATNPDNEWCPPGHGDLYAALVGSGKLDSLLADGIKYMSVSNSDNLGATMDLSLLAHFAASDAPFMMECCERTENDKKGGHLAQRNSDSQLILRER